MVLNSARMIGRMLAKAFVGHCLFAIAVFLILATSGSDASIASPLVASDSLTAADSSSTEPFAWGDFTWMNGSDRRKKPLWSNPYVTGRMLLDVNYTASDQ